jgi:hypothetical protein
MSPKKKRDKTIKEASAERLLDDFTDSQQQVENQSQADMTDEEYVEMMVKKEIERKILRKRGDETLELSSTEFGMTDESPPEIPEGSCPSCHYCTIIKRIENTVYCVCANPNREVEGMYFDNRMWVKSEANLSCHKDPPDIKVQKQLKQHLDAKKIKKVINEPEAKAALEKEQPQIIESEVTNFFEQDMVRVEQDLVRVEDEGIVEEPDVPTVFIRPPDPRKRIIENELVDDLLKKESTALYKHKALETLKKYRKDEPLDIRTETPVVQLIMSEKMAPIRNCEICYFCVGTRRVGGSIWCHCTNLARSTETTISASWVRSRLNAPCWRREEIDFH